MVDVDQTRGRKSRRDDDLPTWVPVGRERLALWHRPRLVSIPRLATAGCTAVLTLLSEREGAQQIGDLVQQAGMRWYLVPLPNGHPPTGELRETFKAVLLDVAGRIGEGDSVLLHCSA